MASHSYFVVKKLFLIAQKQGMSIPVLSADKDNQWQNSNLLEGMPENEIIGESIRLYKRDAVLNDIEARKIGLIT